MTSTSSSANSTSAPQSSDDLSEKGAIFEINDPEINVEDIMGQIRQKIRQRRSKAVSDGLDFEQLTQGVGDMPANSQISADVYRLLRQMGENQSRTWVALNLAPQKSQGIPVIGGLLQRVRAALHQLVLYYVQAAVTKQSNFNAATTQTMAQLIAALEREAQLLTTREAKLERRLQELERRERPDGQ